MNCSFIYITTKDKEEAREIGKELVNSQLIACANVIDSILSIYEWEGKVYEEGEAVLICKTSSAKVDAVIDRVKSMHSYTCPCIVSLPISNGYKPFLDWVSRI